MKPSRFAANRSARLGLKKPPLRITADLSAFDAMIDGLEQDVEEAMRPAIQAGAQVLYEAVLRNVDAIGTVTGTLRGAIYQAYSKKESTPGRPVYDISWRTSDAALDENAQPIRTGLPVARHAHLLEYGWIQRYAMRVGPDGQWYTQVRPEFRGNKTTGKKRAPPPKRKAPQSVKDAYYMLRPGGPVQHPAKAFVRSAAAHFPQAIDAAMTKFWSLVLKV